MLEHERDLACLCGLLDEAAGGRFRVALVGPAGSGKSALLTALGARAKRRGMRVLRACGVESEREYPFGVLRQMFEPAVAGLEPLARSELFAGAAALAEPLVGGGVRRGLGPGTADGGFLCSMASIGCWSGCVSLARPC